MKNLIFMTFMIIVTTTATAQIVDIPDENFKNALLGQAVTIDTNNDGEIQISEAQSATLILTTGDEITDITGVEAFTNLETLDCSNNLIETVDLSQNLNLTDIRLGGNPLSSLDISDQVELERLTLNSTSIANIDLTNNVFLERLDLSGTQITEIDLSSNIGLELIQISNTLISSIDLTVLPELKSFNAGGAPSTLGQLDLSGNPLLEVLSFRGTPISEINLDNNPNLIMVDVGFNQIASVDVSNNPNIESLVISGNPIESMDVSNLANLKLFSFNFTEIATIDLSTNAMLCSLTGTGNDNLIYVNVQNGNNERFGTDESCEVSAFAISGGADPGVNFIGSDNLENICVDNIQFAEDNFDGVIDSATYLEDCSLSTEDFEQGTLSIFPNPTRDVINISQPIRSATLYDMSGKLVLKARSNSISLSKHADGLYILQVQTEEGTATRKIIKQS